MVKILLLVKDEDEFKSECKHLQAHYFETEYIGAAEEACARVEEGNGDIVVCDAELPETKRLLKLRNETLLFPVMFIVSESGNPFSEPDFKLGLDDLIVKPFSPDELVHRIMADVVRAKLSMPDTLVIGKLSMKGNEHSAYYDGKPMPFSVREFDILFKLLANPKKTFTRPQLMASFWSAETTTGSRTIDVYMAKIREKISMCDEFEIVTMHGLGYKAIIHSY